MFPDVQGRDGRSRILPPTLRFLGALLGLMLALTAIVVGAVPAAAQEVASPSAVAAHTYDSFATTYDSSKTVVATQCRTGSPSATPARDHEAGGLATAASTRQPAPFLGFAVAAETADSAVATAVRDAAESCLNSFAGDTPVTMADGSEKPISRVKVGDKVLATDPETGRTEARPVSALIRHSGKHTMVDLTLDDGSKITTTDRHPFWDATTRTFTDAIDLRIGDKVLSAKGRTLAVSAEYVYDRDLTAYNLQIDGIHTYYAGSTPVLVHNSCGINPAPYERQLENGITRSYGKFRPASTDGPTAGARYVRETGGPGGPLGWMESYYEDGTVRQIHPKGGDYPHYLFDPLGNFMGSW